MDERWTVNLEITERSILDKLIALQRIDGSSLQDILLRCFRERYGMQCIALGL